MISEVILHIGMEKTGSSSIQSSFQAYDDGKLVYAPVEWANHSLPIQVIFKPYGNQSPGLTAQGLSRDEMLKLRERALQQLNAAFQLDRERMIISAEGILSLDAEQHDNLRRFVTKRAKSYRVMAYVRDPLSYAPSSFQQGLKNGIGLFRVPRQHFRNRIGPVMDVFGEDRVDLIHFDPKSFPDNSVVRDFAKRMGADPARLEEKRANESMSMYAAGALFLWNREGMKSAGAPDLFKARIQLVRHLLNNSKARRNPLAQLAGSGSNPSAMDERGVMKFRFADALVRDRLAMRDVRWMEDHLGKKLMKRKRQSGSEEPDYGIRSEQDFVDVGEAAFAWLTPLLKRYKLPSPAGNTVAALDTLYKYLLDRSDSTADA